jgi:MoxR-like ATPase
MFEQQNGVFRFHPGPIFAQLVLADEVNRASPKTQSALLEAMEERQVTSEGETRPLPEPFFVIATQNPAYQIGTFPLPESQLDRFMMRIALGYPPPDAERTLLSERDRRDLLPEVQTVLPPRDLLLLQAQVNAVKTTPALLDYVLALVRYTREHVGLRMGLSPRAGLSIRRAAQAWALLDGRGGAIPEDVQLLPVGRNGQAVALPYPLAHRRSSESRPLGAVSRCVSNRAAVPARGCRQYAQVAWPQLR